MLEDYVDMKRAGIAVVLLLTLGANTAVADPQPHAQAGLAPSGCSIDAVPASTPQSGLQPRTPVTLTASCTSGDSPIDFHWNEFGVTRASMMFYPSETTTSTITPSNAIGAGPTVSTTVYVETGGAGGTGPAVSVVPGSLAFAAQVVGASSVPTTVTITNIGIIPRRVNVYRSGIICLAGPAPCYTPPGWTDFSLTTTCGSNLTQLPPLPPGGSCTAEVAFTPTGTGPRTSAVTIYPENIFSTPELRLSGTGLAAPIPTADRWPLVVLVLLLALGAFGRTRLRHRGE